jgi:ABC-type Fe3+/spermidine/putrescine transport system ATPase subunit
MPAVSLKNIGNAVYQNLDLEIRNGERLVILGPNGSGKTTLLNVIAGLTSYHGSVCFNGQSIDHLPANRRGIGYLFQSLALFPHLDVAANIAYSLKMRHWPPLRVKERVGELLSLLHIVPLASRYPAALSGGEKQRVAIARALASSQSLLLLDEPMASLDEQSAKYLRLELMQIQRRLGITMLYVTHDLMEAIRLGDRMAVILNGRIEQVDEPERILFFPINERVSDFIGAPNILDCDDILHTGKGVVEVTCSGLKLMVPHDGGSLRKIAILPRHIYVSEDKPKGRGINRFRATVTEIVYGDDRVRIHLEVGGTMLSAELSHPVFSELRLSPGKGVYIILRMKRIRVLEGDGRLQGVNHPATR